jgi:hypothetical protein
MIDQRTGKEIVSPADALTPGFVLFKAIDPHMDVYVRAADVQAVQDHGRPIVELLLRGGARLSVEGAFDDVFQRLISIPTFDRPDLRFP